MVTLYNVISSDGYISRKDGSEDFIPDELWPETLNFFMKYDALVMGRKTYDAIQKYPKELLEPFEKLLGKKVVVTRDRKNFHPKKEYVIAHSAQDTPMMGNNVLVSSGPNLNTFLLENKLVDKVIFHKIPIEVGEGVKPFSTLTGRNLVLVSEVELDNGILESEYQVVR